MQSSQCFSRLKNFSHFPPHTVPIFLSTASGQANDSVVYKGRPARGRKLKIPGQSRADRKRLYNTNRAHINSRGKIYNEKVFDEHKGCMCSFKCTEVIPVDHRRRLFSQFWSIASFPGRVAFLATCVSADAIKRFISKDNVTNHGGLREYLIYGSPVCQKAILKTLQISDNRLYTAIKKLVKNNTLCDLRGQFSGGRNALSESKKNEVRAHIASFPKYVSHYTRGKSESKYLNADLSLAKLYLLYAQEADNPVSQSYYNNRFYKDFNLRFKQPKKDMCHKCDFFHIKINSSSGVEREMYEECHRIHLECAESLRSQMGRDLAAAKLDRFLEVLTFDLQKILLLPNLTTSIIYYLRQLNLYNFGIHTGSTGSGKFNIWTEDEASKGTQEVGSCLKSHIDEITRPIKQLILWSDSCGGQNRSIKLILMLMYILHNHETLESISMRYLQSGHSFLPNDSEFGEVETALKRFQHLYTDEHYMKVMKECRTKNGFEVKRMSAEDFFSVHGLESLITNRKVDLNREKVSWLDTHEILMEKSQPGIIKMRKKIDGPFQSVNLNKTGYLLDMKDTVLGSLWPTGRNLSKEKIKDLRSLIDLIPPEHQHFYYERLNRVGEADFIDDIDGFGETIDFELETQ